jgi:DNA-binding PadR family transcriptional regulator
MGYLGEFEQLILFSILQLGDGAYGVSIRETIEDRTGRTISVGAIYTALGRLEERGLVRSRAEAPGAARRGRMGRPRKYYRLRREGARALKESYTTIQSMAGGLIPRLTDLAEG